MSNSSQKFSKTFSVIIIIILVVSFVGIIMTATLKPGELYLAAHGDQEALSAIGLGRQLQDIYYFLTSNNSVRSTINQIIFILLLIFVVVFLKKRIGNDNNKTI
ncbi:MAG: hypothetical protein COU31_04340 [Candidatus Magasanikbacteria bacterium CG10_big_fil_rev_8_21_14_0_10_40_10]|uniref:Uncharacterized protein n=1 Tax=Candidatus Magasanikbacteria bacterium CG10_big_fil_rev_8_21_14_0_10_40_10 TaxID=1974648 RepID=A0A2M6W304_9BACT|nr:MAG: hypothetical protein COU31_04340 [Candidatus Magasanikbacteria bacterium CG10_big_fil_rev_8_21_14_0_10_40_10]